MKHYDINAKKIEILSLPTRGAWIETTAGLVIRSKLEGRSPLGGRGLKLSYRDNGAVIYKSLPTRGAWIETTEPSHMHKAVLVAPHSGGVD